jgi:hypothetical protein
MAPVNEVHPHECRRFQQTLLGILIGALLVAGLTRLLWANGCAPDCRSLLLLDRQIEIMLLRLVQEQEGDIHSAADMVWDERSELGDDSVLHRILSLPWSASECSDVASIRQALADSDRTIRDLTERLVASDHWSKVLNDRVWGDDAEKWWPEVSFELVECLMLSGSDVAVYFGGRIADAYAASGATQGHWGGEWRDRYATSLLQLIRRRVGLVWMSMHEISRREELQRIAFGELLMILEGAQAADLGARISDALAWIHRPKSVLDSHVRSRLEYELELLATLIPSH